MSTDINDYIETALWTIKEQIEEVCKGMQEAMEGYCQDSSAFAGAMNRLEKLLRTAGDSVEIFQNYNGQYRSNFTLVLGRSPRML